MTAAVLGTLLPKLPFTPSEKGNIALLRSLGLIVASVSIGPLIDKRGKKAGLVSGLLFSAVALMAIASSSRYAVLLPVFLVVGLGGGMVATAANSLVTDITQTGRASALNLLNLFFGLGGMLTPSLGSWLGLPVLCWVVAALTAGVLFVAATTPMPAAAISGARSLDLSEAPQLLARPAMFLLSLVLFSYVACEVGVWDWFASYLTAQGVPESAAQRVVSWGFGLGILLGRIAVSGILRRVAAETVTLGCACLMAVTTFAMLQTRGPVATGVLVFCAGFAMAPVFPTTLAMVGDTFPRGTATAMGIAIMFGWVGLALSSKLIGAIAGADPARLKSALLVIPALSVLLIAVNLALRPVLRVNRS